MPTNAAGATVISAPHSRLSATQLAALDATQARGKEMWDATDNPEGWCTKPFHHRVVTMMTLVRAGLLHRYVARGAGIARYALTEAGRKVAAS